MGAKWAWVRREMFSKFEQVSTDASTGSSMRNEGETNESEHLASNQLSHRPLVIII